MKETLEIWHEFVATQNPVHLDKILSDEVVFHSPVVWGPKKSKPVVTAILLAASRVFSDFEYVREIIDDDNAVLEFSAKVGELELRGVDILAINDGKVVDFEVMVRPANALAALGQRMSEELGLA